MHLIRYMSIASCWLISIFTFPVWFDATCLFVWCQFSGRKSATSLHKWRHCHLKWEIRERSSQQMPCTQNTKQQRSNAKHLISWIEFNFVILFGRWMSASVFNTFGMSFLQCVCLHSDVTTVVAQWRQVKGLGIVGHFVLQPSLH